MGEDRILDVDLLAFERGGETERAAVIDGVRRSLQTGFVYTSHDISGEFLDLAYAQLEELFALPMEVKAGLNGASGGGQGVYTGLLVETAADSDVPDWKEMFNWSRGVEPAHPVRRLFPGYYHDNLLPEAEVPGITKTLMELNDKLLDLQCRFLRIVALGLGVHELYFDDLLVNGLTLNRAIRYPPMSEVAGQAHVWAGAHADSDIITALPRASAPGLQVRTVDGWVDARPPEGSVILNTGMMLERLTNGLIPSGWHRVVADPEFVGERYSVVQFCHPAPWMVLSPLPVCVTAERPQRFGGLRTGDFLEKVLWDINLIARTE
jgi:isopenicillin N synthase-like dioxygenase